MFISADTTPLLRLERMDLNTGDIQPIETPDLVSTIYDTDGQRLLVARLISEIPLESLWDDNEQYEAALQSTTIQYAWWPRPPERWKRCWRIPATVKRTKTTATSPLFTWATTRFPLFIAVSSPSRAVRRTVWSGVLWTAAATRYSSNCRTISAPPSTVNCGGNICWFIVTGKQGIRVYDAATGQSQEVAGGAEIPWPLLLTEDGRVLSSLMAKEGESDVHYRLIPEADYLAGNFDGHDVSRRRNGRKGA